MVLPEYLLFLESLLCSMFTLDPKSSSKTYSNAMQVQGTTSEAL